MITFLQKRFTVFTGSPGIRLPPVVPDAGDDYGKS